MKILWANVNLNQALTRLVSEKKKFIKFWFRFESVKQQLERYYWVSIYWETDYHHTDTYIINAPHIQMFCLIEYKDKCDDFNYLTLQVMNTIEILGFFSFWLAALAHHADLICKL